MSLVLVVSVVAFFVFSFNGEDFVLDFEMIEMINSDPDIPWTAGVNPLFAGKKFKDIEHLLDQSTTLAKGNKNTVKSLFIPTVENLPDDYNFYQKHPECKKEIRNQEQCGSNWAFTGAEVLSDRFCLATEGKDTSILSPQDWVSCDTADYGCQGAYQTRMWDYALENGIVTETCFPYSSGGGDVEACPNKCVDSEDWDTVKHKISNFTHYSSIVEAQEAIMKYGSIQASFFMYQDFYSYVSGVYVHKSGSIGGGNIAKCIGWGVDTESSLPYWNCALSWGADWGMSGYFWMLRGTDQCGFEDGMFGPIPLVEN